MRENSAVFSADHYVQRLDLGADPFQKGYRSDFFFGGGQRRQILDQVLHFSRYSDQVVLLLGSTGSGTSTLMQQLLDRLAPLMDFCTVDAETFTAPEQLLELMCGQLQFTQCNSVAAFLAALRDRSASGDSDDALLVTIDQAHFLSIECLDLLRQLYQQSGGVLHLLLVGEYQVEQLARLAGFDSGRLKLLELEPLSVSDTGDYVLGLLQSVGYAGEQPLSVDQLAVLHEQSGGNITEINLLAPTLLQANNRRGGPALNLSIPVPHMAAIAILVVAIALSYWLKGDSPEAPPPTGVPLAANDTKVPDKPDHSLNADGDTRAAADADDRDREVVELPLPMPEDPPPAASGGANSANTGVVDRASPGVIDLAANTAGGDGQVRDVTPPPASKPASVSKPSQAVKPSSSPAPSSAPAPKPVASTPAPTRAPAPTPAPAPAPKPVQSPPPAVVATPVPAPKQDAVAAAPPPAASQPSAALPPREQHLLAMDTDAFLLQLMGASDESRARGLVKAWVGQLPISYFEARRNAKPWYVVVTGPYPSKEAARDGIAQLPEQLQRQKPWVRSVAGVQEEIRSLHP